MCFIHETKFNRIAFFGILAFSWMSTFPMDNFWNFGNFASIEQSKLFDSCPTHRIMHDTQCLLGM